MSAEEVGVADVASATEASSDPASTSPTVKRKNQETPHLEKKLKGCFIGSIDQGTTSTRFLIFDGVGNPVAQHQVEFTQKYPHPGWHEQDPREILDSVGTCIQEATAQFVSQGHRISDIAAIGITNQRETTVVWDTVTGEPLYNAIAWPDTRTGALVRELKSHKDADKLQEICGLPLSTYPSSVKLLWLLRHVHAVKDAYAEGRLTFGTVDTWLLHWLNGGMEKNHHVTDTTNASRTMFMNLHTLQYDDRLMEFFGLDKEKLHLPRIVPSSCPKSFGVVARGPLKGIRIAGCLGDQSAALVGQQGFTPGAAKNTYGTGCFLLYNVGEKPVMSNHGLLATVAYDFGGSMRVAYALEGSIAVAGSAVKFLSNNLGFFEKSHQIGELAAEVEDNGGCVFVTAFSGLFAPYWIDDAKGTIFGITQYTERGHIARATLEATCFQTKAILDAMELDSGHQLKQLAVDGGMSNSDLCMQTQANIIGIPVDRPAMRETTSLGAAIAAGFAVGIWEKFAELKEINQKNRTDFQPNISEAKRAEMFERWQRAVSMCRGWLDPEDTDEEC
ncbi:glycerol kinase-like protein [Lineolata rhizophorae]|uniref:glycerol kinase n=1 Tax=Lineolata rhizophorae TaxID=578093 RepID=A0A6A6P9R3_9PEZI|nr:glycerol kinase-like protein [Lineolata rhizophorae]